MFELAKNVPLNEFLQGVEELFNSGAVVDKLNIGLNNDISCMGIEAIDENYVNNAEHIIMGFIRGHKVDSRSLTPISEYLTIKTPSESYQKFYLTYIDENFFYNSLESIFYAAALGNEQIMSRFKVGYELWQNSIEIGKAGESKKLGKALPYYITFYGRRALLIDPINGEVYDFDLRSELGSFCKIESIVKEVKDGEYYVRALVNGGKWCNLAQASGFGEFDFKSLIDIKRNEHNKRKSNRGDNTGWLTCDLDNTVDGHNRTIRVHNLVALMVYGLECVKYTLMEGNSILTIDHWNGVHYDNKIDNLQILTRKANYDKERGKAPYCYDFADLWLVRVPRARARQEELDFRRNSP